MAQNSARSDLQVDDRQDEFPTVQESLDDEFPTVYQHQLQPQQNSGSPSVQISDHSSSSKSNLGDRICGLRRSTFWLGLALAVVLVISIVGISITVGLAAKRKSDLNHMYVAHPPMLVWV